ncbi:MAG: DUF4133 domain-containing protein [Porphyromonas sp.]|uniref:DUF4133 domain-containing protein n=1 Tax=Porphyromonas sp. TaxID=1924944 RepID=UPI002A75B7CC|nr:DUF4133 domain-containing protein [Porphyromonas sp.]MDY3112587.1 DUF4133 domain-containing protein [Porphyromonas sp.]
MTYEVNKGIGASIEFKGLKSQYLVIFACGLGGVFLVAVVLNLVGVPSVLMVGISALLATVLVYTVFKMNKKYGTHGLMKLRAVAKHPDYLIHRRTVRSMLRCATQRK